MATPPAIEWINKDLILNIRLQPRASRDEVVGLHNQRLKIRITAPPVDGQANAHLILYLSRLFKTPRSDICLLSGQTGRNKRVRIQLPRFVPADIKRFMEHK